MSAVAYSEPAADRGSLAVAVHAHSSAVVVTLYRSGADHPVGDCCNVGCVARVCRYSCWAMACRHSGGRRSQRLGVVRSDRLADGALRQAEVEQACCSRAATLCAVDGERIYGFERALQRPVDTIRWLVALVWGRIWVYAFKELLSY